MNQIDPLNDWVFWSYEEIPATRIAEMQTEISKRLQVLIKYLDDAPERPDFRDAIRQLHWCSHYPAGFRHKEVPLVQNAFRSIFETGGMGANEGQETLLTILAAGADPHTVPFWQDLLDLTKPHDQFRQRRQTISLAALAIIAIRHNDLDAYQVLYEATTHDNPEIRATGIYYLGRAFTEAGRDIPKEILATLANTAVQDDFFEPRFQARSLLRIAQQPVPFDNPDGVYDFKVIQLQNRRVHRTIAVQSEQTLRDLQRFIQHAFEWDNDHLFCFYMNGRKYDDRYSFACAHEKDRPPWAHEAVIGELGLVKKHRFLYHFDYGDDHLFEIEVIDIRPNVQPENYPRLIDSVGKAPPQYG
jgi:hypothetical protein